MKELGVLKLHKNVVVPKYGTEHSACLDICSCFDRETNIKFWDEKNEKFELTWTASKDTSQRYIEIVKGERFLIPTGIIFMIPHGYSLRIHPRSGLSLKVGLHMPNSQGVVDSDYPNETFVMMENTSDKFIKIENHQAIAQIEIVKKHEIKIFDVENVSDIIEHVKGSNRVGGFGSTDKN